MTPSGIIIFYFTIFCRVGSCLMIAPGFSSERIPVQLRLYLSIAIALLITPLEIQKIPEVFFPVNQTGILFLITHELLVGLMYGLIGRIFIFALESLMTTFSLTIGLSNIFETGIFDIESSPVLSTLIILISIQLILVTDLHHMLIRGIDHSFTIAPISENLDLSGLIQEITLILSQSYLLALRITSPFIFFAIIVNLSFAFLARLAPHVQIYFVTGPIVIFSGMYFFHLVSADFLAAFIGSFRNIFSGG